MNIWLDRSQKLDKTHPLKEKEQISESRNPYIPRQVVSIDMRAYCFLKKI